MFISQFTVREDSQIDSAMGSVGFALRGGGRGGGVLKKNVFQILAIIDFSSGEITGKTLSVRENIIGNINIKSMINRDLNDWLQGSHSYSYIFPGLFKDEIQIFQDNFFRFIVPKARFAMSNSHCSVKLGISGPFILWYL